MRINGHIDDLLIGRAMLVRAMNHLKDFTRTMDLNCSLLKDDPYGDDHIGIWKKWNKENGYDEGGDDYFYMMECPLCSAQFAAFRARKLLKGRAGRINGILTRMGNNLREKE